MKRVPYRERLRMLNKVVEAIGCCGMGDGVKVVGVLTQISPYPIVTVTRNWRGVKSEMPYEVNEHTLVMLELSETGVKNVTLPL